MMFFLAIIFTESGAESGATEKSQKTAPPPPPPPPPAAKQDTVGQKAQLKAQPCTNADGEGFDVYQCDMDHPNLFSECREKQAECANLNKEL